MGTEPGEINIQISVIPPDDPGVSEPFCGVRRSSLPHTAVCGHATVQTSRGPTTVDFHYRLPSPASSERIREAIDAGIGGILTTIEDLCRPATR